MNTLETVLAILTVISFGLTLFSFTRNYISKTKEQAKVEVFKERLKHLNSGLESLFQSANAMVQLPKKGDMHIEQLQDLARILRSQIYMLSEETKKDQLRLDEWQYGVMLFSKPPTIDSKEKLQDNCIAN